jgi:hypothetical protein
MAPRNPVIIAIAVAIGGLAATSGRADENGVIVKGPEYACADDKVASILEVCKAVKDVFPFVACPTLNTKCFRASQEVFTGLSGETANPVNIKPWNGQGVSGGIYQSVGLCLLRDLDAAPMTAHAEASLPAGTIAADAVVDYMSFDPKTKTFNGSHRLTATAPAFGTLDLMTQTFEVKAVDSNLIGQGKKVGQYAVAGAHALDFSADAGAENFDFTLEGIVISTPYGTVTPKPYVNVARASFWSLSPYGGSTAMTMNPGGFQTSDVYGRLKGQAVASALKPVKFVPEPQNTMTRLPFCGFTLKDKPHCLAPNPVAWDSQAMLGARNVDPRPSAAAWTAPAGALFPLRPDPDVKTARGDSEKLPNGAAKAGVRIEYDILGLLPQALLNQSFIGVPEHVIFADPNVFVGFASQFNFWNAQASVWNPALAAPPQPVVSPIDVESIQSMALYGGASVAGRFAIDAGVDLRINVHIPLCCFLDDIDFDIINIHPRAPFLETIEAATEPAPRQAFVSSSAQTAVKTGKPFQAYQSLLGGSTDGVTHLAACFADPPMSKKPTPPKYKKGDPMDLLKVLDMQCNLCVGHADFTYVDGVEGKPGAYQAKTATGFAQKIPYVSDAALPASERWVCGGEPPHPASIAGPAGALDASKIKTKAAADAFNKAAQIAATNSIKNIGCFDQCRVDQATGKFTKIVKSAKTLYAEGKITGAPNGCY